MAALMMPLIIALQDSASISAPNGASSFLNTLAELFATIPQQYKLLTVILVILILTIVKNISLYYSNSISNELMLKIGISIRRHCIQFFMNQQLGFYKKSQTGELLSKVNEQVQRSEMLVNYLLTIVSNTLVILFLLALLIALSPALTAYVVFIIVILGFLLKRLFKAVSVNGNSAAGYISEFSGCIGEIISGMRVIKAFNGQNTEIKRADLVLKKRFDAELRSWRLQSAVGPITETIGIMLVLSILFIGTWLNSGDGRIELALVITYLFALMRMWPRLNHLNGVRAQFLQFYGSLVNINKMLTNEDFIEAKQGMLDFVNLKEEICFEDVTYVYPGNKAPSLRNISLVLKRGTSTALVGMSGGGKSTIADLLMGFIVPNSGKVLFDGVNVNDFRLESIRGKIGLVSQDPFLFNASIRENISYGSKGVSETRIIEAAKSAYAYEFIQSLPDGFDTIVGDRGSSLSGGQRQRIAIARAILSNPDILILDEATSALDFKSEKWVQMAIQEASINRTVLIIAHKLSTIQGADNIIVIEDGIIKEQGSSEALIALEGAYYHLYRHGQVVD